MRVAFVLRRSFGAEPEREEAGQVVALEVRPEDGAQQRRRRVPALGVGRRVAAAAALAAALALPRRRQPAPPSPSTTRVIRLCVCLALGLAIPVGRDPREGFPKSGS